MPIVASGPVCIISFPLPTPSTATSWSLGHVASPQQGAVLHPLWPSLLPSPLTVVEEGGGQPLSHSAQETFVRLPHFPHNPRSTASS